MIRMGERKYIFFVKLKGDTYANDQWKSANDQNMDATLMARDLTPSVASTTNSSFSVRWQ